YRQEGDLAKREDELRGKRIGWGKTLIDELKRGPSEWGKMFVVHNHSDAQDENDKVVKIDDDVKSAYKQAWELYDGVVKNHEVVLRRKHPDTVQIWLNLGKWYTSQGDYDYAEFYLKLALDTGKEIFGTEHPLVALISSELAYT